MAPKVIATGVSLIFAILRPRCARIRVLVLKSKLLRPQRHLSLYDLEHFFHEIANRKNKIWKEFLEIFIRVVENWKWILIVVFIFEWLLKMQRKLENDRYIEPSIRQSYENSIIDEKSFWGYWSYDCKKVHFESKVTMCKSLELFHIENSFENECQLIIDRYNARFRERYLYFFFATYFRCYLIIRIVIDMMITWKTSIVTIRNRPTFVFNWTTKMWKAS